VRRVLIGILAVAGLVTIGILVAGSPGSHGDIRWMMPVRLFNHPSESMAPTLNVGDRSVAYRSWGRNFAHGDVIVFRVRDQIWVKRIAALPGDTIQMRDGIVILNGKPVTQKPAGEGPSLPEGPTRRFIEQFPGEQAPHQILDSGFSSADVTDLFVVPAGKVFVLGDNRDDSADSRFSDDRLGSGMVALDDIYGTIYPPAPK
jgi:signal peptidase I